MYCRGIACFRLHRARDRGDLRYGYAAFDFLVCEPTEMRFRRSCSLFVSRIFASARLEWWRPVRGGAARASGLCPFPGRPVRPRPYPLRSGSAPSAPARGLFLFWGLAPALSLAPLHGVLRPRRGAPHATSPPLVEALWSANSPLTRPREGG